MFDEEKVRKWFDEKWPTSKRTCEICHNKDQNWDLIPFVTKVTELNTQRLALSRITFPQIHAVCNNCGYMRTFSAIKMGVVPRQEEHIPSSTNEKEKDIPAKIGLFQTLRGWLT